MDYNIVTTDKPSYMFQRRLEQLASAFHQQTIRQLDSSWPTGDFFILFFIYLF